MIDYDTKEMNIDTINRNIKSDNAILLNTISTDMNEEQFLSEAFQYL